MKSFFKQNKNILLVCTYVIVLLAALLNYQNIMNFIGSTLNLLRPLYMAIGIAFVLNIPMRRIESLLRKGIKEGSVLSRFIRAISILLTIIFALVIIYLLLIIILPKVSDSLLYIMSGFNDLVDRTIKSINVILADFNIDFKLQDISFVKELQATTWKDIFDQSVGVVSDFANGVVTNAMAFTSAFFQWFLGFCLSIYLLHGKERYISQMKKAILSFFTIRHSKRVFEIGTKANFVFTRFIGGQLVDCAIKGIMFYIVFLILGYNFAELLAMIITVCSIVPVFGPIFAMMICFILIFAFDPMQAVIFIVIFQVLSNLESQIIYPRIVGKSIGLPGLWVLLSIFVLGDRFGILGMLFAVPITALVYDLVVEYVKKRLRNKKIQVVDDIIIVDGIEHEEEIV